MRPAWLPTAHHVREKEPIGLHGTRVTQRIAGQVLPLMLACKHSAQEQLTLNQ